MERQFDDLKEQEITFGGKTLVMREMAGATREKYDSLLNLMSKYEQRVEAAVTEEEAIQAAEDLSRLRGKIMKIWFPEEDAAWLDTQRTKERYIELLFLQIELNKDEALSKKLRSQVPLP